MVSFEHSDSAVTHPALTTYSINHEATIDLDSTNAFEGTFPAAFLLGMPC